MRSCSIILVPNEWSQNNVQEDEWFGDITGEAFITRSTTEAALTRQPQADVLASLKKVNKTRWKS